MNTAQLSQTLLAPWRQRDRDAPWGRWLLSASVLVPAVGAAVWMQGAAARVVPAVMLVLALYIVWMVVSASLLVQNDPAAARFVPGHVKSLQQAALVGWAACTTLAALLLWVALPPLLMWQTLLLGSAAAATFALWASRVWWLWLMLCLYSPLLVVFRESLASPMLAAHEAWLSHTHGLLALGLLGLAALVPAAFGHGDTRHRRAYERLRRMQAMQRMFQEGRQATPAQTFATLERVSGPFIAVIALWGRRLLASADNSRTSSVMARLEVVLHANQHWTYQLLAAVLIVAMVSASLAAVVAWTSVPAAVMLQHGAFGMGIGLASMAINPTLARPMLWQTRREQALLRLLPHVPQGRALNRAVAWIALRHALVATLLVTLALSGLGWATGQWGLLWLPVLALPWSLWTATRAPALMPPPSGLRSMLPVLAYYLSALLGYLATDRLGLPMVPLVAAVLVLSALWGAVRWRQLDSQLVALPAGRLA